MTGQDIGTEIADDELFTLFYSLVSATKLSPFFKQEDIFEYDSQVLTDPEFRAGFDSVLDSLRFLRKEESPLFFPKVVKRAYQLELGSEEELNKMIRFFAFIQQHHYNETNEPSDVYTLRNDNLSWLERFDEARFQYELRGIQAIADINSAPAELITKKAQEVIRLVYALSHSMVDLCVIINNLWEQGRFDLKLEDKEEEDYLNNRLKQIRNELRGYEFLF